MALSASRTPILDYATSNPIPIYAPPTPVVDPGNTWLTESGGLTVITEAGVQILWDANTNVDGDAPYDSA